MSGIDGYLEARKVSLWLSVKSFHPKDIFEISDKDYDFDKSPCISCKKNNDSLGHVF